MKILVVDDHPLVRDAMVHLLAPLADSIDVLEASDCTTALSLARAHPDIDLVLLDLNLPGIRGFEALDRLRQAQPALPVVILSMHRDRATVLEAIRRGALGFIPKASAKNVVVNAVRLVLSGGTYLPPEAVVDIAEPECESLHAALASSPSRSLADLGLTPRQGQVLALIMRGNSNKEICRALDIAERTVKVHITAVLNALKVTSRTQAVIAANDLGLTAYALLDGSFRAPFPIVPRQAPFNRSSLPRAFPDIRRRTESEAAPRARSCGAPMDASSTTSRSPTRPCPASLCATTICSTSQTT